MQSSADALALIRKKVHPKDDGKSLDALRIDIENVVHVNLAPSSPDHIIMTAELHEFRGRVNEAVMRSMLEANAFGESTGPARLSIEADSRPMLSLELPASNQTEATLIENVIEFMNCAAYWQSIGTDMLVAAASGRRSEPEPVNEWDDVMLVRV
jgi:hypothetical protein